MRVLIACEESQRVCTAFRQRGHEAYSCDIIDCSGGHPEWHIKQDVLPLLNGNCRFTTADGAEHTISSKWDLIIAHPPCTYLTVCANKFYNINRYGQKAEKRLKDREAAIEFFMKFVYADCEHVAIENPVGVISTRYRKPDQIIHPYFFGENFSKSTCLWLKNLPKLKATNVVDKGEFVTFSSGKKMPKWYSDLFKNCKTQTERSLMRSKTFQGVAKAMAEQWG